MIVAFILLLALTRAEIIERFKAPPVTKLSGLVQVHAAIPSDMRREYQVPVAGFAADVCRRLYAALRMQPVKFAEPGIVISIRDGRGPDTNVFSRVVKVAGDRRYTRITLPSPGYSDMRSFRAEVAKAFYLAVQGEEISSGEAVMRLRASDPDMRVEDECAMIAAWERDGVYEEGMTDEDYLKISRKVLKPGVVTEHDLKVFSSRLYLYPLAFGMPFCGRYTCLAFDNAIQLRNDPGVRIAALVKSRQLLIFGAGRGDGMQDAAKSYSDFLAEMCRGRKTEAELALMLKEADEKLNKVKVQR